MLLFFPISTDNDVSDFFSFNQSHITPLSENKTQRKFHRAFPSAGIKQTILLEDLVSPIKAGRVILKSTPKADFILIGCAREMDPALINEVSDIIQMMAISHPITVINELVDHVEGARSLITLLSEKITIHTVDLIADLTKKHTRTGSTAP